ncbi:flagellar basal body rod protein [Sinobaca sp. H24]|uniref:lmo0954 family membrane protein n=1 Tax=Sinobaca sp. H24 TaxID=2923376 RepID=UPI0020794B92|nr:flagellar basal body rod protein [Sinobaca sp. H24]
MKKFGLIVLALFAVIVLLANLGPLLLLALGVFAAYAAYVQYQKSFSTGGRILWVLLGITGIVLAVSNIYAILGALAAWLLYWCWEKYKGLNEARSFKDHDDPFSSFDREWSRLQK